MLRGCRPSGEPVVPRGWCAALVVLAFLGGCAPHIQSYEPKRRDWKSPVPIAGSGAERVAPASLWPSDERSRVVDWGDRPSRVGDMVNVQIDEYLDAQGGASTALQRDAEYEAKIQAMLGLMDKLSKEKGQDSLVSASVSDMFQGEGTTRRENRVTAVFPAMVRQVLSNGNLFIEGHRVILLNQEENHFYISGVIRPVDIDAGNIVKSSRIADAEIEITGRGVVSEQNRPGWLGRALRWVWPF